MTSPPSVRAPALDASLALPAGAGAFRCRSLKLSDDGRELTAGFERTASSDWIEVFVFQDEKRRRAITRLEHCSVGYRGALRERTSEHRAEVAALVRSIGQSVDDRLAARPGASIAEALGRRSETATLVFGREALLALLAPELLPGGEPVFGFQLSDVYPSSHLREAASDELVLVLDFRRSADGRRALFELSRRADNRPALASSRHFTLTRLTFGMAATEGEAELAALLSFVLELRDHERLRVEFPDVKAELALPLLPAAAPNRADSAQVLNLAINTPCGQACRFCSVQELAPPVRGDARLDARLRADLRSNRERGVRRVRINGYDPLSYPALLELLDYARDLGYQRADLFSPCTRLADRDFCAALLARLPSERRIHVPLYGASAEVHDSVVGRPGAFDEVRRALEHLRELTAPSDVTLQGVATRDALGELEATAELARSLGLPFSAHMPYPSSEAPDDAFFGSVPRQTDVADAMARSLARGVGLAVNGVAPCVVFRSMARAGVELARWLETQGKRRALPGTEYRSQDFVHRAQQTDHSAFAAPSVPCPHVALCSLSPVCPRELLLAYVKTHGSDEFSPVPVEALLAAPRG